MSQNLYRYKLITDQGKALHGIIKTTSEQDLTAILNPSKNHLIRMRKLGSFEALLFLPRISDQDLLNLTLQWNYLLKAGVSLIDTLNTLIQAHSSTMIQSSMRRVLIQLQAGEKLFQALNSAPFLFDSLYCHLVQVGEQQGKLAEAFENLVFHLRKRLDMKEKIKKATLYPLFLIAIMILLFFSMVFFVLPTMKDFIVSIGSELPPATLFLLSIGETIDQYGFLFLGLLTLTSLTLWSLYMLSNPIAQRFDALLLKVPVIGGLLLKHNIVRYLTHFCILCDNGRTVVKALKESPVIVPNYYLRSQFHKLSLKIHEGLSLSELFEGVPWMPRLIVQMIKVGENSGKLTQVLSFAEEYLHKDLWERMEKFVRMLEPLCLMVIGSFFLWIVIAIFLPLYDHVGVMQ